MGRRFFQHAIAIRSVQKILLAIAIFVLPLKRLTRPICAIADFYKYMPPPHPLSCNNKVVYDMTSPTRPPQPSRPLYPLAVEPWGREGEGWLLANEDDDVVIGQRMKSS